MATFGVAIASAGAWAFSFQEEATELGILSACLDIFQGQARGHEMDREMTVHHALRRGLRDVPRVRSCSIAGGWAEHF